MSTFPSEPWRVVVHVDDDIPDRQRLAVGNISNLLDDRGENRDRLVVEMVANGPGISAVTSGSTVTADVAALLARGVIVLGCANSLSARGLTPADVLPGVRVVPAGISHLVRRQHEGWAYVRP